MASPLTAFSNLLFNGIYYLNIKPLSIINILPPFFNNYFVSIFKMIKAGKIFLLFTVCLLVNLLLSSFNKQDAHPANFKMPFKQAGLTERQAAAHLIDRFTFGNSPGYLDKVVKSGLENWFLQQLEGKQNDADLNNRLSGYDALQMSNTQVLTTFPRASTILKEAVSEGIISKDSLKENGRKEYQEAIKAYMEKKGYRPQKELFRQFVSQKILSAAYSNNQLQQVLTEFWFNHFNVSISKNQCAPFVPAYERDVIRPNVTDKFGALLLATAQSPAMLFYLDNFSSAGQNNDFKQRQQNLQQRLERKAVQAKDEDTAGNRAMLMEKLSSSKKNQGLNENYAREIMELHTLGVDGGYSQQDVTNAAKVLTGWTVYPMANGPGGAIKKMIEKFGEDNLAAKGFVHKGDFLFAINKHDNQAKTVLGKLFAAGGGYQDGLDLINLLAHHAATAKFICKKLAVKFVSDNPPASLIDKMAATFLANDGDIKEVLKTMVAAPEFWTKDAIAQKTKSPLELAISSVRALDATVNMPFMMYQWVSKMGQKLYYYQAPTGFPDKGQYWINTGALLNRMNFGLAFASQKIPGVEFNLAAINNNHEPESAIDALKTYSKIILPERDVDATIKRLTALVNDPSIQQKIDEAAGKATANSDQNHVVLEENKEAEIVMLDQNNERTMSEDKLARKNLGKRTKAGSEQIPSSAGNNSMLAQVVGIIIGSPEFQKR